jgi:hypothetical protein
MVPQPQPDTNTPLNPRFQGTTTVNNNGEPREEVARIYGHVNITEKAQRKQD